MDQALMNHMIAVGKAYYNGIEDAITEDYLQDVVGVLGKWRQHLLEAKSTVTHEQ